MAADINCKNILFDAIESLNDEEELNNTLLDKRIQLLNYFAGEVTSNYDNETESWLEKLAFDFCFKYFEKINFCELKPFYKECFQLLTCCFQSRNIVKLLLERCLFVLQTKKLSTDAAVAEDSSCKFVIPLIQDIFRSVSDIDLKSLRQDIIATVIDLSKSEDITESCFILMCGLLKSAMAVSTTEGNHELLWTLLAYLHDKKRYEWLMLVTSILVSVIGQSNIIEKNEFWRILQGGLVCPDPLTSKRAQFILKWLVDFVSTKESFSVEPNEDGLIFIWTSTKSKEIWDIWRTVILLLETLDEKQMHVISPVLPSINDVLLACILSENDGQNILHFSWLLVILRKSIKHESKLLNKWAINYLMKSSMEQYLVASKESLQFIFVDLLESLQAVFIYNKEDDLSWGSPPLILEMMSCFLSNCFKHYPGCQLEFVDLILDTFLTSSFNNLSLIYFTEALSRQTTSKSLKKNQVFKFKQFCYSKIRIYRIEYQRVLFHNLSVFYTKNIIPEIDIVLDAINLLSYAIERDLTNFNSKCWGLWQKWFERMKASTKDQVLFGEIQGLYGNNSFEDSNCIQFSVLILFQYSISPTKDARKLFGGLNEVVSKLYSNPYLPPVKILKALKYMNALLKATLQFNVADVTNIIDFLVSSLPNILEHIISTSRNLNVTQESFDMYTECLLLLEKHIQLSLSQFNNDMKIMTHLEKFSSTVESSILLTDLNCISQVFEQVRTDDGYDVLITKLFTPQLLKSLLQNNVSIKDPQSLCITVIKIILNCNRKFLNSVCKKNGFPISVSCDSFLSDLWNSLGLLIDKFLASGNCEISDKDLLHETFFSDITIVSHENIFHVVQFASRFVPLFKTDVDQLLSIIDYMWKVVKDQSQTDSSFWRIYQACLQCIFHRNLLLSTDSMIIGKLKEIWGKILEEGEGRFHLVCLFVTHCVGVWKQSDDVGMYLIHYIDELISTVTFGPLMNKTVRPMNDMIYYLHNTNRYDGIDGLRAAHYSIEKTRVDVINFLLNLEKGKSLPDFFNKLKLDVLQVVLKLSGSKKGYYLNTLVHRKVLRSWQLFLSLFVKCPSSFNYESVLPSLFSAVKSAHQTSIRYLIEWCILLIFHNESRFIEILLKEMEEASEKQVLSITSIMSLCTHLAVLLTGENFQMFVRRAIPKILPWSHAQHLTSRMHSQVALETIWENIVGKQHTELQMEFQFLAYCFSHSVQNTSAVRHRKELKEQFFYSQFHPIKHYSLETIYNKFPAHCSVLNDEWIFVDRFEYHEGASTGGSLVLNVHDHGLKMPSKGNEIETENIPKQSEEKLIDIQKKIMPWRVVPPTEDIILQSELQNKKESVSSELILCAVLVDKIPNLGGLCRTSEIFGVGSMIIGSQNYVKDQGFKSLSVSAERWLNIEQVLPIKLAAYLVDMKKEGYRLVGVEQTANSKMVGEFKFPKKTVLLLGNEKTGIPVDLIQLLDDCVEIPQVGIIRSLNVHISGAIMIWEYCKQHVLQMTSSS